MTDPQLLWDNFEIQFYTVLSNRLNIPFEEPHLVLYETYETLYTVRCFMKKRYLGGIIFFEIQNGREMTNEEFEVYSEQKIDEALDLLDEHEERWYQHFGENN